LWFTLTAMSWFHPAWHRLPMRAVVIALLLVGGCDEKSPPRRSPPSTIAPLDLNEATEKQLEALPAIGPKHAKSIIASRNARGGRFTSVDQLLEIDGIGPKTIDAIRPYVVVH
jgi:competence ComEA-like helix-hairpin-helix protein